MPPLSELTQVAILGVTSGGIYALLGVGISVIQGLTRLVNFAHGHLMVFGAYVTWVLVEEGVDPFVALTLAGLGLAALALPTERLLFRPTLRRPINGFIVSLGLIIVLETVMTLLWTDEPRQVIPPLRGSWEIAGVLLPKQRALVLLLTLAILGALYLLIQSTRYGRFMRACAQDREAAAVLGIPVERTITLTFVIAFALAGVGGGLMATLIAFTPTTGGVFAIKGLAAALIGGLGNTTGVAVAGLGLGLLETFGATYWAPEWRDGFGFGAAIILLLIKPHGLFRAVQDEI